LAALKAVNKSRNKSPSTFVQLEQFGMTLQINVFTAHFKTSLFKRIQALGNGNVIATVHSKLSQKLMAKKLVNLDIDRLLTLFKH